MTISKVTICGQVPTVYQSSSLYKFRLPVSKNGDGSFSVEAEFPSKEDAIEVLKSKAYNWYQEGLFDEDEFNEAMDDIEKYGQLTYDAATVKIVEESLTIPE